MGGSILNREDYKTAIPQLSSQLNDLLQNNVIINRTVITLSEGKVSDLNTYLGYFQNLTTGYFQAIAGDIEYLSSREAYINHLKTDIASFGYLTAETADLRYATISNLNAAVARIGDLEADHVSVSDLTAATGRISDLEADHVSVSDLTAATGRIGALEADHVSVTDLAATNADVAHLKVGDLTIGGVTVNIYDLAIAIKNSAMASGTTWYKVSASTPAAPAVFDPTSDGWSQTEPAYVGGTTDHLYSCLRVVYADDDPLGIRHFQWSDVHMIQSWEAAKSAYSYAGDAEDAANKARSDLSIVEDVVNTVDWIQRHGTYKACTETAVIVGKVYYTLTGAAIASPAGNPHSNKYYELVNGKYVLSEDTEVDSQKTYYSVTPSTVADPTGDPSTNPYYELVITESVYQYVNTRLALTDSGLSVTDGSSSSVLISSDGVTIISKGQTVGQYGEGATIGNTGGYHIKISGNRLAFKNADTEIAYMTNDELYIPRVVVVDSMKIGNWIWDAMSSETHLTLKWEG